VGEDVNKSYTHIPFFVQKKYCFDILLKSSELDIAIFLIQPHEPYELLTT